MKRLRTRETAPILAVGLVMVGLTVAALAQGPAVEAPRRSEVPANINANFLDPDLEPEAWLERFEVESREVFSSRRAVVEALGLRPGDRVADIGAGTGLYLEPFARAVGLGGRVFAVDISPKFTDFLRRRAMAERLTHVDVVLSKADSAELPEGSVNAVFVCDTYHHFEYHEAMLASIRRALRPGGQLVVIDFDRVPGQSREWLLEHVRAGKAEFRAEIESAGFEFVEEVAIPGFEENYFLRFRRP